MCATFTRAPAAEVLKELTDSKYTVYDVLPTFFNHPDPYLVYGKHTLQNSSVQIRIDVLCSFV